MKTPTTPRIELGQVVATPGALDLLTRYQRNPQDFLNRHRHGDWGNLSSEDWEANQNALETGARILSSYKLTDTVQLWIITEAVGDNGRRASTCILLPEDY